MDFSFGQLFDRFSTPESYTILIILLVAFLFGLAVGLLLRAGRVRRLRRELEELKPQLEAQEKTIEGFQSELSSTKRKLAERDKIFEQQQRELEEAEKNVLRLEREKNERYHELEEVSEELEQVRASNRSYLSTIEELNDQILGIKARQEQEWSEQQSPAGKDTREKPENKDTLSDRLEVIEARMMRLEQENDKLRRQMQRTDQPPTDEGPEMSVAAASLPPETEEEETTTTAVTTDSDQARDDLTLIRGIGPFIQEKLYALDVFYYSQIAEWESEQIRKMTDALEYFRGRIEKDDWVGQARELERLKREEPELLRRMANHPSDPGNLQTIEGIDAETEAYLKDSGIHNWKDLADSDADNLRSLLQKDDAPTQNDPRTWPIQARLALNGDWNLLEEYQQQLLGGHELKGEEGEGH